MTDWDKFKETKLLLTEAFYSKLNMTGVGNEDYEHANRVWKEIGIKNLGEYHNLYIKTDVIILANVFKAFRKERWIRSSSLLYSSWISLESLFKENEDTSRALIGPRYAINVGERDQRRKHPIR